MNKIVNSLEELKQAKKYYQNGEISKSAALLRKLLKHSPSYYQAAHFLSKIEFEIKNYNLAKKYSHMAVREAKSAGALMETMLPLMKDYAYLLTKLSDFKASTTICDEILYLKPDDEQVALFKVINTRSDGQFEDGLLLINDLITKQANNVRADMLCERGEIFIGLKKHEEALKNFDQASELDPNFGHSYFGKAKVFYEREEYKNALKNLDKAIKVHPLFVEAYVLRGSSAMALREYREALKSYDKAIELNVDYAPAHAGRGRLLFSIGRLEEALISFERSIQINGQVPEFHLLRLRNLMALGTKTKAADCLNRAMELSNNNISDITEVADIMIESGDFIAAKEYIHRGLKINPHDSSLLSLLPKCQKMTIADSSWFETARSLINDNALSNKEKITLNFSLGKYLDDIGSYDLAFQYYKKANDLQKSQPYNSDDFVSFAEKRRLMKNQFYPEVYEKLQAKIEAVQGLIFIVGMPRSGTSLVEQILASHPKVVGVGEVDFPNDGDFEFTPKKLADIAELYLWNIKRYKEQFPYVVNKMPHNHIFLGLIHAIFPTARIIHCYRNPIDTCLSIYFQEFNRIHSYAVDLDQLADEYRDYIDIMNHWKKVLPERILLDLPYEALVDDQKAWTSKMLKFIGLDWDDRCMQFYENNRAVKTPSRWQVRQGIYKTSKERWRNYEPYITPLLPLLEISAK